MTTAGVRTVTITSPGHQRASSTDVVGAGLQSQSASLGAVATRRRHRHDHQQRPESRARLARCRQRRGPPRSHELCPTGRRPSPYHVQGVQNHDHSGHRDRLGARLRQRPTGRSPSSRLASRSRVADHRNDDAVGQRHRVVRRGRDPQRPGTALSSVQNVRAGGPAVIVTLTNSNATVAQLSSDEPAATGQTVTKPIQPGIYHTQAIAAGTSYGLAFDPLAGGTTTVTVTSPAATTMTTAGVRTVTITSPGISVSATDTVGAGLQSANSAHARRRRSTAASPSRSPSSDPTRVLVSPDAERPGTPRSRGCAQRADVYSLLCAGRTEHDRLRPP